MLHKPHYCYLRGEEIIVLTKKPPNFAELPYHYKTHCPNKDIAKLAYRAHLKITKLREAKDARRN